MFENQPPTPVNVTGPFGSQAAAAALAVYTARETLYDTATANSPAAANTASVLCTWTDLEDCENLALEATIKGTDGTAAGGPLDFVAQCSPDGVTWTDWHRFTQVASGDAAKSYRVPIGLPNAQVAVTRETAVGTTITLAAGATAGGHPGSQVRIKCVSGAGVNHAIAQTFALICQRPKSS